MYVLSKVLLGLASPSALLMLLLLWGVWVHWATYGKRGSRRTAIAALALICSALSPLSAWLLLPLEERFQRPLVGNAQEFAGLIVLGGAVVGDLSASRDSPQLNRSAERVVESIALARRHPHLQVILSGGTSAILTDEPPEAGLTLSIFTSMGVEPGRVRLEEASRNTAENARATRALLLPKAATEGAFVPGRWLLVTSAAHMPRAMGSFRQAGFDVQAYPVDYVTAGPADRVRFLKSPASNLLDLDNAAREWSGLLIYWLRGDSNALFPTP